MKLRNNFTCVKLSKFNFKYQNFGSSCMNIFFSNFTCHQLITHTNFINGQGDEFIYITQEVTTLDFILNQNTLCQNDALLCNKLGGHHSNV